MSRIKVLLQDLTADRRPGRISVRWVLSAEQWTEVLEAYERGVTAKAIFAALTGKVTPFFSDPKQFTNALNAERTARRKAPKT